MMRKSIVSPGRKVLILAPPSLLENWGAEVCSCSNACVRSSAASGSGSCTIPVCSPRAGTQRAVAGPFRPTRFILTPIGAQVVPTWRWAEADPSDCDAVQPEAASRCARLGGRLRSHPHLLVQLCDTRRGVRISSRLRRFVQGRVGGQGTCTLLLPARGRTSHLHTHGWAGHQAFKALARARIALMICDEAQTLKNAGTKTYRVLDQLKCERRLVLSGTPLQNNLSEVRAYYVCTSCVFDSDVPSRTCYVHFHAFHIDVQLRCMHSTALVSSAADACCACRHAMVRCITSLRS